MSFTPQVVTGSSADGEYVYYNATVVNNKVQTEKRTADPELYFQDTRQNPLIKDSAKYVMSVDNFTISGAQKNIPLFIPQIQPGVINPITGQPDINLTIYTVTFGIFINNPVSPGLSPIGGSVITATVPITWVPENIGQTVIATPTTTTPRQEESPYYYCYTYQHWVNLMNNALTAAWRDVIYKTQTLWSTFEIGPAITKCPFFEFNPETGLFSLCQDGNTAWVSNGTNIAGDFQVYSAPQGVSDAIQPYGPFAGPNAGDWGTNQGEYSFVGMNSNLEGLISNFDTVYFGFQNPLALLSTGGSIYTATDSYVVAPGNVVWTDNTTVYYPDFVFNCLPDQLAGTIFQLQPPFDSPAATPVITYIRNRQNYISTGSLWSPVASFVLTTSTIPVRFEGTAAPVDLGASNQGGTTASSGASQKVLLEVPINALTADMWRGFIDYKPLVPLFSSLDPVHDGIINLDVKVCWRNRLTNSLIPLTMYNSSSFTMRLRFVRKAA